MWLPLLAPPCLNSLARNGTPTGWRQGSGTGLSALGGSQLRQGHGSRIPGIGHIGWRLGLSGMRERMARLGGRMELRSAPGAGTAVVATLVRAPEAVHLDGVAKP